MAMSRTAVDHARRMAPDIVRPAARRVVGLLRPDATKDAPPAMVRELSWPLSRLGEAIQGLARLNRLLPETSEPVDRPAEDLGVDIAECSRWIGWAGDRLGVEAVETEVTVAGLDDMLSRGGPAILSFVDAGALRFVALMPARGRTPRLLCPDLVVRTCRAEDLRAAMVDRLEAPLRHEVDRLLAAMAVSPDRRARVRSALILERIGTRRLSGLWILRLPPSASLRRQVVRAGIAAGLVKVTGLFALVYGLEILGWRMIGDAALNGRLDFGWLQAWILVVLTAMLIRIGAGWINASQAIEAGRLFKTRLLSGTLRMDLKLLRSEGASQMLTRTMEAQAFEGLAINGGLAALVAVLELACAIWLLSLGAGGWPHVLMLLIWAGAGVVLALRYLRRLELWTHHRLGMTHDLIERMVGHRTTLAQEQAGRRDREDDHAMTDYLEASSALDRSVTPFLAGIPSGWMVLGLAGLAPALIARSATTETLAIALGGVLLGARALAGLSTGLASAARAVIAWRKVEPLLRLAASPEPVPPFIPARHLMAATGPESGTPLIDAEDVTFRHDTNGRRVLDGASLRIEHGERLLIEGPSGGGKSTLASILVGLRVPESGLVLLNGLDRHTLGANWHAVATQAPQFHENHVFNGTLAFNLLMGRQWPPSDTDLAEAEAICEELGLAGLVERMPSGLMQVVGETGWQLSHGERSRLFLARALLQSAPLTILDESFAALDPETLRLCLVCAFRRAHTLVVIAHP